MRVFIWKIHGCLQVYHCETLEQCKFILSEIKCVVNDWGDEEQSAVVGGAEKMLNMLQDSRVSVARKLIKTLTDDWVRGGCRAFEYCTFIKVQGPLTEEVSKQP